MLQHEVRGVKDIYLVLSSHTPSNFLLLELGESTFIRGIPRWRVIDSFVFACLLYLSNFQHLITTLRMITTKKIKVLEKGKALCHVRYRCQLETLSCDSSSFALLSLHYQMQQVWYKNTSWFQRKQRQKMVFNQNHSFSEPQKF